MINSTPFDIASKILHLDGKPFDLSDRKYLRPLYNDNVKRQVFRFSRQAEKCCVKSQDILMSDSSYKKIENMVVGDLVTTLNEESLKTEYNKVIGVFDNGEKEVIEIITERSSIIVTKNHPIKTIFDWTLAGDLSVGEYVGSIIINHEDRGLIPLEISDTIDSEFFKKLIDSDIYWDKIVSIKNIGIRPTYNLEIERNNNFVLNNIFTHNSTTLASKMAVMGAMIPGFKSLYVAPTSKQTRVFSSVRLKEFLDSPFIQKNLVDNKCDESVFKKSLKNRSHFFLEYCFLTPDRTRGLSADMVLLDEIQDLQTDFVPVIEESTSHSKYKLFVYAGTPKSMDNTIEYYWEKSDQKELAVKCQHCNFWNIGLGMKNIGKEGLICSRCERSLDNTKNEWIRCVDEAIYSGYHLNALNTPWLTDWKEILVKKELYPTERFYNEVLGLPFDGGTRPITQQEVIACCADRSMTPSTNRFSSPMFCGIDWSVTNDVSLTVLTIGEFAPYPSKYKVHFAKAYDQSMSDPRAQTEDIIRICKEYGVSCIGADWGAGSVQNIRLAEVFGTERVIQFFHTGNQQERIKLNRKRWVYTLNRTFVMADLFLDIIKKKIEFFRWEEFQKPFGQHILNIHTDVRKNNQKETMYYDHRIDRPDDFFHALLFGKLAAEIFYRGGIK